MPNKVVCPKCGKNNEPKALKCSSCGYEIVPVQLKFLLDVPDVDASIIQKIYMAGFKNVEALKNASVKDLAKIDGVSKIVAERIKQHILKLILKHEFVETEQKAALYICSNCGALLGPSSTKCHNCGAVVISDEASTVPIERKVEEEERLIKEMEKPKISLFLCSNCGAFVSSEAKFCPNCGALMEETGEKAAEEAKEAPEPSLMVAQEEMDGAIIGVCNACGAFLSRTAKTCPVCGSPSEENITVAISSGGPGEKIETEKAREIYGFDPRLETQGKIFLCEVCGAFVSQGAETCPICNSPTANMKKEVIRIGEGVEMSSDEVINLLEKEIIHAMESADGGKREREVEVRQEPVLEEKVEPEIVELPSFEDVEKELRESLPEHQPDTGKEEEMEQVNHLVDVHSAVTSEIGDILVESVVRERFTVEETETPEKVEHTHDPVADVESELWEYLLESEEEMPVKENECPICGYKNSPDAEKCEICGSTIKEEKVEEIPGAEEKEKVKKEVVEEQALPETKFKEVKKETPLPLVSARVKPLPLEKKGALESMLEKNSHILLAVSLALVGIGGVLALGLTIQAAGVIALGFLIVGAFFSFLILRSQKKPQKSVRVSQPSRPSEIALFNMGSTYLATGRFAEAVKAFEEVVKINPGNEVAWNNLGSALSKLERHEEALKCYEKALEIKPDFEIVWNNKGNALARLGRFEEALKCYDKAIALRRDYHDAWVNKGYVLVKTGRYNEAIACANEANKILERAYG